MAWVKAINIRINRQWRICFNFEKSNGNGSAFNVEGCDFAKSIGVPPQRIGAIVSDGRTITADTDLRLCHFFRISEGFFLRLQAQHDLEIARKSLKTFLEGMPDYTEILQATRDRTEIENLG